MLGKVTKKFQCRAEMNEVQSVMEKVDAILVELAVEELDKTRSMLQLEELLVALIKHSAVESMLTVSVEKFFGRVKVRLNCRSEEFDLSALDEQLVEGVEAEEEREALLNVLGRALKQKVSIGYKRGITTCTLKVSEAKRQFIFSVLLSMVLGVMCGALLEFLFPVAVTTFISSNCFDTINTLFARALSTIVCGMVFFSIASSIGASQDLRSVGRIATKIFGFYICTSILAIAVGYATYQLLPFGDPALASAIKATVKTTEVIAQPSLKEMLLSIVPPDLVSPFMKGEMLQIIFLALLVGTVCGILNREDSRISQMLSVGDRIFTKAMEIIVMSLPLVVFCSMANMILLLPREGVFSILSYLPLCYAGYFFMLCVYALILVMLGRINPFTFFKGFYPAMLVAFSTCSSSMTIPVTLKQCQEKLGISSKVCSFSIPFGATINMDGFCVAQILTVLYVANIFQVPLSSGQLLSVCITIMAIAMATPGIPGTFVVTMTILLRAANLPVDIVFLLAGIFSLLEGVETMVNVTGDAVVTAIVAKSEGLIEGCGETRGEGNEGTRNEE